MKKSCIAISLFITAAIGCCGHLSAVDFDGSKPVADNPPPASVPQPKPAREKEWTVMVYLNGKNDVEEYGLKNVNKMETVGSGEDVNVVVELGRIVGGTAEDGDWTGSRRMYIRQDEDRNSVTSPVLQSFDRVDMGDWRHLADFITWARASYPAKRYMLVIWNHGSGWKKSRFPTQKGISYDYETGHHISTPELAQALQQGGKVDLLAFDACMMQMIEVDYQVRHYADFIAGSEEISPAGSYPYDTILRKLSAKPSMPTEELGMTVVDSFQDFYRLMHESTTISLVRTDTLDELAALARTWTEIMTGLPAEKPALKAAADKSQSFYFPENKDMADFADITSKSAVTPELRNKSADVASFLTGRVIAASRTTFGYPAARGMAAYIPPSAPEEGYGDLAWANDTGWLKFIEWLGR